MKNFLLLFLIISLNACKKVSSSNDTETEKNAKTVNNSIENNKKSTNLINKIELNNISFKCVGEGTRAASVYGSGVTFFFTIKNNTNIGIKSVSLNGTFKFDGRSYVYSEDINYEFQKGLEPRETQEIAMKPGPFSKWNDKIKPGDNGKLSFKILEIEDYNGESIGITK